MTNSATRSQICHRASQTFSDRQWRPLWRIFGISVN